MAAATRAAVGRDALIRRTLPGRKPFIFEFAKVRRAPTLQFYRKCQLAQERRLYPWYIVR